jgi:hypothetical protein
MSILLITGTSIVLFPDNVGNHDNSPWGKFYFNQYKTVFETEVFIEKFNLNKSGFGSILVDESMAALLTKNMKIEEYGYLNNFSLGLQEKADTVIFYVSDTPLNRISIQKMNSIVLKNNFINICKFMDTNIVIATNKNNILEKICN